jgi:two-component system response regulator MprA
MNFAAARTDTNMDARVDRRPLVLIVDGDARSASLLARLLRADGYDTDVTTDGAAALARLTRDPVPSAIVTDFHLPHADGLAIGRYARSRREGIPIFVVTGYPQSLDHVTGWTGEPIVLMTKPLDYHDLLCRLVATLGTSQDTR